MFLAVSKKKLLQVQEKSPRGVGGERRYNKGEDTWT